MKKFTLLLMAIAMMTFSVSAEKIVVLFAGYPLETVLAEHIAGVDANMSYDKVGTYDNPTTIDVPNFGTITFEGNKCAGTQQNGKYFAHMPNGTTMTVTPANGVTFTSMLYNAPTVNTGGTGDVAGLVPSTGSFTYKANAKLGEGVWTGNSSTPVKFTSANIGSGTNYQFTRMQYLVLEYTGTASGVSEVVVSPNGEVKYFDMQGNRVKEPVKGQPTIRKEGAKTTKVIVK